MPAQDALNDIGAANKLPEIYLSEEELNEATIATPWNRDGTVPIGRIVHRRMRVGDESL
jgi:hypothetical protein